MKRPGCCTLCEKPVFEILQEQDGEPKALGLPTQDAWRVTFLLSDDTQADVTFCMDCLPKIHRSRKRIWMKILERFDFEERGRETPPEAQKVLMHLSGVSIEKEIGRRLWGEIV